MSEILGYIGPIQECYYTDYMFLFLLWSNPSADRLYSCAQGFIYKTTEIYRVIFLKLDGNQDPDLQVQPINLSDFKYLKRHGLRSVQFTGLFLYQTCK